MPDDSYSFTAARSRLEEIVTQVRKKDTSLEKSLDLLEEGVRLANQCTELIDHADWERAGISAAGDELTAAGPTTGERDAESDEAQVESDGPSSDSEVDGEPRTEAPDDERS